MSVNDEDLHLAFHLTPDSNTLAYFQGHCVVGKVKMKVVFVCCDPIESEICVVVTYIRHRQFSDTSLNLAPSPPPPHTHTHTPIKKGNSVIVSCLRLFKGENKFCWVQTPILALRCDLDLFFTWNYVKNCMRIPLESIVGWLLHA